MAQPTTTSSRQNTLRPAERPKREAPASFRNTTPRSDSPREQKRRRMPALTFGWISGDERASLAGGMFCMLLAVALVAAFISYLFNGPADQSAVSMSGSEPLSEAGAEAQNWVGLLGAYVAHVFMFRWFGIGALVLPIIVFLAGYKLAFRHELLPLARTTQVLLFVAVWMSLLLGYVVLATNTVETGSIWCGGVGYTINVMLRNLLGWGSLLLILFGLFAFVVFFFNVTSIKLPALPSLPSRPRRQYDDVDEAYQEEDLPDIEEPQYEPTASTDDDDVLETPVDQPEPAPIANGVPQPLTLNTPPTGSGKHNRPTPGPLTLTIEDTSHLAEIANAEVPLVTPGFDSDTPPIEASTDQLLDTHGPFDPTLELGNYQYPTTNLLTEYPENSGSGKSQVTADELEANKDRIVETLQNYGITIDHIKATIGPTVTLYEIVPSAGVRISKIKSLEDDIALSLAALGIRIIAPMPGKGTIGIEVPNKNREMVSIRSVMTSDKFAKANMDLPIALGKTISNEFFVVDLAKMPHLLMAGATGQGKSVGLNVLLTSLLYKKHPSQLKLVLVDPKKVELTLFNKIERHFLAKLPDSDEPIITDTKKVVNTLNSLCIEMDNRYNLLKEAGCRNIKEYNVKFVQRKLNPEKGHHYLPYIVLVIDELADLMMTAGKEVEQPIARLAQLARAIGIHLVVATQRPSVNVITGLIKANFPARLSFKVTSKIDSRTILDTGGAEQLVGMGDMLLSSNSDIIRLQCPFVDTDEIEHICEFVGNQRGYDEAYFLPEFVGDEGGQTERDDVDLANRDPMFDEAARLVVIHQQGSTSLIQRRLKLGYNRAGRLIDQLEKAGIVGSFEGSKARDVLIHDPQALEEVLKNLN